MKTECQRESHKTTRKSPRRAACGSCFVRWRRPEPIGASGISIWVFRTWAHARSWLALTAAIFLRRRRLLSQDGGTDRHHSAVRDVLYRPPQSLLIEHLLDHLVAQRVYGLALGYEDLNDHDDLGAIPYWRQSWAKRSHRADGNASATEAKRWLARAPSTASN